MTWAGPNRPNFTTNKIEVTSAYEKRTKTTTAPKSTRSVRTVEMVPTVRRLLSSQLRTKGWSSTVQQEA